jgi:hypothetical protein
MLSAPKVDIPLCTWHGGPTLPPLEEEEEEAAAVAADIATNVRFSFFPKRSSSSSSAVFFFFFGTSPAPVVGPLPSAPVPTVGRDAAPPLPLLLLPLLLLLALLARALANIELLVPELLFFGMKELIQPSDRFSRTKRKVFPHRKYEGRWVAHDIQMRESDLQDGRADRRASR